MAARARTRARLVTDALVVRFVPYGETDAVVTLFTERLGRVPVMARGARKQGRKLSGALEPMHGLVATLAEKPGSELYGLEDATIARSRTRLASRLASLEAAGRALRWVRAASPPRTPEPEVWAALVELLDRLDAPELDDGAARVALAATGLRLLGAFGWGLELGGCVSCGKPCAPERPSFVDAGRGGLVCRACGAGRVVVDGATRARLQAAQAGDDGALGEADVEVTLDLVDAALAAHGGIEPTR